MDMSTIIKKLGLLNLTPEIKLKKQFDITRGHASDLLSDVLANAPEGGILVTIQVHINVIAVALHAGLSAVIFSSGMVPEERIRQKAVEEGLPLFMSEQTSFNVVGKLYELGLRGK